MSFRGEGRRKPHNPFLRVQEKGSFVHSCRAVLIAAPASGQGKTTVTAALARQVRARGACVRVFKTGPDFLDPTILEKASGAPAYQLDLFMGGEAHCRRLLAEAARAAGTNPNAGPTEEAVYRAGRLTASYIHLYFPSNPTAIANVFSLWPEP